MDWRKQHKEVLESFLSFLYSQTSQYILKGGTALAQCYGLDRFSEDIDLDGKDDQIIELCQQFATNNAYECRVAKNTDVVKRCMMHYGGSKPLKIEMSARKNNIPETEVVQINGIRTYSIDAMTILKTMAYEHRDKIRDLFDVSFIVNHYYDQLSDMAKIAIQNALEYKGLEHFDYIVSNQTDELIDPDLLAENFLSACDKAGILFDQEAISLFRDEQYDDPEL